MACTEAGCLLLPEVATGSADLAWHRTRHRLAGVEEALCPPEAAGQMAPGVVLDQGELRGCTPGSGVGQRTRQEVRMGGRSGAAR